VLSRGEVMLNPPLVAFFIALQFLTRIPLPPIPGSSESRNFARATLAFPLIGLVIGLILVLSQWVFNGFSEMLQAALVVTVWVWITGNLHLDGLADSADAWIGGQGSKERTLEIMKDPTSGPTAISAVVLTILLKFTAVYAVLEINPWLLILPPIIARTLLLPWFMTAPYVRHDGLASVFVRDLNSSHAWLAASLTALVLMLLFGGDLIYVIAVAAGVMALWRYLGMRRIGGFTGDTSGAMVEMVEVAVLILVLSMGIG